jgi:biopolymer transport protein ExbD
MAEIDTGGGKKVSTKVDMTPMVDLAFLLVTFFMLTTTFSKPQTMEINMPDKTRDNETMKVKESRTLSLVLTKNDKIYYYQGVEDPVLEVTDFSANGIRKVLLKKKAEIMANTGEGPIIVIKSKKDARYGNLVDILDEMSITGIEIYALVDITPEDEELVAKAEAAGIK